METRIQQFEQTNVPTIIESQTKAEIDIQIATAKHYPRDIRNSLQKIETYATITEDVAGSCFYNLSRSGRTIEGPSTRLAEIVASQWGNIRTQVRILPHDGKTVTAEAVCLDLETNVAYAGQASRRITDKYGKTYNEDMIVVTSQAAASVALRNAIFKIVPPAILTDIFNHIKQVSVGSLKDMRTTRQNLLTAYSKMNVSEQMILDLMEKKDVSELDLDAIKVLRGIYNALKEGETSVEESFIQPVEQRKKEKEQTETQKSVLEAMAKQTEAK